MKIGSSDPRWVRSNLDSDTEWEKLVPLEGTEPASDAQPFLWTMSSGPTPAFPDTSRALFGKSKQPPLTQAGSGHIASVKRHFSWKCHFVEGKGSLPGCRGGMVSLGVPAGRVKPAPQVWRPQGRRPDPGALLGLRGPPSGLTAQAYLTVLSSISVRVSLHRHCRGSQWPLTPGDPRSLCTQPYLQRTASLSGRASYTHTSLSSSSPVTATVRPRSRAAVASLMVQPMGTWKGRSLQSCRALCRGCPSHPQPLPQGAHLVGREPSACQGEGRAQPGLQQLIRHPDTSPLAALGLLPAGFNLQSWPRPLLRLCRAVLSLVPAAARGTEQTAEQEGSYKPLTRATSSRTRLLP